jgi:hypothetical protein
LPILDWRQKWLTAICNRQSGNVQLGRFGRGPVAAGAKLDELRLAGGRIEHPLLEKVRVEAAQRLLVAVAHAITHLGAFPAFLAYFCHKIRSLKISQHKLSFGLPIVKPN